ncbi:hypothetical protein CANCADRAFT_25338 [Tortispora caseinolytica NRRL Y-17796]|uniref:2,4-dienoyl-CoA reductase [(3E)-enoyl-CoA-producing] n=1 Tax=Tortispora caseinolytica NRRL Y-17796 TaxID=767744 RepID=A0A1E4TEX7_9ASCO|nr:hypothetical protein CANCADRAFT_25338 [Tortispora caseinolytica NRRL Y-17796]
MHGVEKIFQPDIFKNKVVFCTGGAGTICRGQVEALVALGANATIVGRNKEKTEKAAAEMSKIRHDAKVIGLSVDVRNYESLAAAVKTTVEQLGGIDILICGAAGNFLATIEQLSPNAFKTVMDIDVLGSFNTFKAASDELIKSKGQVIFVSATLHYRGVPYQGHVSAAKAAIDSLSQVIAIEYGPKGVRSNIIAPGPIAGTEGMDRLSPNQDATAKSVPVGRMGTISDIALSTVYLCSDAASFVNGAVVVVDGGSWHVTSTFVNYPEDVINPKVFKVAGTKKSKSSSKI